MICGLPWVKISKVMPQSPTLFPGKGREASQQKFSVPQLKQNMA